MGCVYTNIGVLLLFSPKDDGSGRKNYLSLDNCFFCFENQLALTITSNDVRLNSAPPTIIAKQIRFAILCTIVLINPLHNLDSQIL